jgi:hypothetical protein
MRRNKLIHHESLDGSHYVGYTRRGTAFTFDKGDLALVGLHSWHVSKRGYLATKYKGRVVPLHRLLLGNPKGMNVDHVNRDKMDNRRRNLRLCTPQENSFNQSIRKTNTTGYIGVSKVKDRHAFEAYIHYCGRKYHIGTFPDEILAARVRDNAAAMLFGSFASLNFPQRQGVASF